MSVGEVIWSATADDQTWRIEVHQISPRAAKYTITQIATNKVIFDDYVSLSYGAGRGWINIDDIRMWRHMAIEAIDHFNAHRHKDRRKKS